MSPARKHTPASTRQMIHGAELWCAVPLTNSSLLSLPPCTIQITGTSTRNTAVALHHALRVVGNGGCGFLPEDIIL